MKKIKKSSTKSPLNLALFQPEKKASRVTIDSRTCNQDKFNELFNILDCTKEFKNIISTYCFTNLTSLLTNYSDFQKKYTLFKSNYLNSWEKQNLFQEITGHYYETATRYLSQATYIVQKKSVKNSQIIKVKTRVNSIASYIDKNSNLILDQTITSKPNTEKETNITIYKLDFDIENKLISLNSYLSKYKQDLDENKKLTHHNNSIKTTDDLHKEEIRLEKLITSYEKIIKTYEEIKDFSLNKPFIYSKLIALITVKKLRLLKRVKLGIYETGTHARHLDNAQLSIVKDLANSKYQYFLKVRKLNKLTTHEPKLKISKELIEELKYLKQIKHQAAYETKLAKYNEDNFIYLPLVFNHEKLKQIGRKLDTILSKDNPQVLLKSEQLRIGKNSRKIHLIFKYEENSNLGTIIENNKYITPNELNTLALDVNVKHNLLADSNGKFYDEILKVDKHKFIDNLNEIVLLQSIEAEKRTTKQKYRYQKLLRANESLLKTYLSVLIKDWKAQDIQHLVLEDLNLIGDKSYYEHAGVKIKYSRLARLLRLSQIKLWVASMAEKQGLFTHLVNPAYTSQECSLCHHISPLNRVKQEIFKCTNKNCSQHNIEMNADSNSALNIKNRILNRELRNKLNKDNVYLCARPKPIYYKSVKTIIDEVYKSNGVVTELFPENIASRIQSKKEEASPFRAG